MGLRRKGTGNIRGKGDRKRDVRGRGAGGDKREHREGRSRYGGGGGMMSEDGAEKIQEE